MSTQSNDHVIGIIFAGIFLLLTLFVPFIGIVGGFYNMDLPYESGGIDINAEADCLWDGIEVTVHFIITASATLDYDDLAEGSQAGALWNLLGLWGFVYLLFTLLGGGAVAIYAFLKMGGGTVNPLLNTGGVALGLIGTVGEWVIMSLAIMSEDWSTTDTGMGIPAGSYTPQINIILLALFIVGWVCLIYGSMRAAKLAMVSTKEEPTLSEY